MRPILKPPLADALFAIPPSDLLLQSFGEYCSVSEQPLPSRHYVWHKRLGIDMSAPVAQSYWKDLLLLSENSFLAQLGKPLPALLFPDESQRLTYSFDGRGPLSYQLQTVLVIIQDEQGQRVWQDKKDAVIVSGDNEEAQATIEYFALNTQFYHAADATFLIPQQAQRTGFDRRVAQRTQAWHHAAAFAEAWRETLERAGEDEGERALIGQAQRLAAATGYWSTWASSLAHHQVSAAVIREILLRPQTHWEVGPGPHNPYPGTNPRVAP